jgi:adenosylcobinamide-GDP ribazoletransferase
MREARAALMAVMFLTRIPVPSLPDFRDEDLQAAARWFPAVGALVGAAQAMVLLGAALILPPMVAALLALAAALMITGAFHEDGLADAVDGLGGGYTRERVLTIMKDSRIGSFGAAALVIALALQAVALAELLALPAAIIAAHAASRFVALSIMATQDYVRDDDSARAKPLATRIGAGGLAFGAVTALLPALFLPWQAACAGAGAMLAARIYWGWVCRRRLGGYTGDMLGAAQQISFTAGLLGVVAAS